MGITVQVIDNRLWVVFHGSNGRELCENYLTRNNAILMLSELGDAISSIKSKLSEVEHVPDEPKAQKYIDELDQKILIQAQA